MEKKWIGLLLTILVTVTLAACGSSDETARDSENASEEIPKEQIIQDEVAKEQENGESESTEETKNKDEEVFRSSGENEEKQEPSENLFDSDKVFYYAEDAVEIRLSNASFVQEFTATNADVDSTLGSRTILSDSETFLHITGTINNDTTNILHYGHKLAPIKFFLLYDGKHEFESLAGTEEEDGTKIGGASVNSLSEGKVHIYFQIPKTVSETDKPLVLKVLMDEEVFEIPLR
ncbi:hypothetical protein [Fredinandcohnia sp. 179-A 10B2 NHS]|uniref:hypothetical protein n=1 Tax=Fredinandcohnia sp. 179-A 10B2 NHS TaxID=3235176 RepID=UPI0039A2BBE5